MVTLCLFRFELGIEVVLNCCLLTCGFGAVPNGGMFPNKLRVC